MKRILFVDPEVAVLENLRLRLHPVQHKWDMTFTDSGGQALAHFQSHPYDVIVSEVRMPGMQGGRLLRTVGERWPSAIRIALSGLSDPAQALRLAPFAHQFLSKPCSAQQIEDVIERCLALQELLQKQSLRTLVGRMQRVPSLRGIYSKLQLLLARENATAEEVATLIGNDPIIAAKVLQMANSAFFRRGRRITNMEQAVIYLGIALVRSLVLSAEIFMQWPDSRAGVPVNLEKLAHHSQQVTTVTHAITRGMELADDSLMAALLHDVGYWLLAHECPQELQRAHELALREKQPLHQAEKQMIGASHAEIGAYLLGIWGLPYSVVEAVAHHHEPAQVPQHGFDALGALALAHALVPGGDSEAFVTPTAEPEVGAEYLTALGAPFDWEHAKRVAGSALAQTGGAQ